MVFIYKKGFYQKPFFYMDCKSRHLLGFAPDRCQKLSIMEEMKILYVITSTETGGAEKALEGLAMYMAQNHTVRVISLKPLGPVADSLKQAGIEVISLQMKWYSQGRIIRKLGRQITDFQPDLVHAMLYRAMEYTRMACAGKKVKLITTPHFDFSKKSVILRWIDRLLKELDTLTVAESFATARYLVEKQKYAKQKVYLLPNGADPSFFFPDRSLRNQMRIRYGFTEENTVFLSVARLAPVKNPILLLQAFRNVWQRDSSVRLVYVGEGPERSKLAEYIRLYQLEESVWLAGEQTDINSWLNMADVFVLWSMEESLPLALLEALRVGLACLVSRVGDMPLWVEHGQNGFVGNPQDLTLLSCFMAEMVSDRERRREMGEKSLEISQRMTATFPQYQHLYQQVINQSFHVKTNA